MRLATLGECNARRYARRGVARRGRYAAARQSRQRCRQALEEWDRVEPALRTIAAELVPARGDARSIPALLAAPLPRAWQWLDGSAFASHGELMQIAFGVDPPIAPTCR